MSRVDLAIASWKNNARCKQQEHAAFECFMLLNMRKLMYACVPIGVMLVTVVVAVIIN